MVAFGVFEDGEARHPHRLDHEDVAYDGHGGGRGCRGHAEQAHFLGAARVEADVGLVRQRAVGVAGDDDELQFGVQLAREVCEFDDFACFARVGDEQQQVVLLQYSEVAVLSFAWVEEHGRDACRAERCGDVHRNLSCLAHARCHELAPLAVHLFHYEFDGFAVVVSHGDVQHGRRFVTQQLLNVFFHIVVVMR